MKLEKLPVEFSNALPILQKIRNAGYEAYFVGGSVRDVLLNRTIHDVDIATSSYPAETKQIFDHTIDIGIEHGTVLVLENGGEYEVTTFRTEDVYVDYRRPSHVTFVRQLSEDLLRRDFTINAFALADDGQVIDLHGGLADLNNQILRAVGNPSERFNEDALRIMRGLRFVAVLNFELESETFASMAAQVHLLAKISIERIFIELDKLLTAEFWQKGFGNLLAIKAEQYLPDFSDSTALHVLLDLPNDFKFTNSVQAWGYLLYQLGHVDGKILLKKWKVSREFSLSVTNFLTAYRTRLARDFSSEDLYHLGQSSLILVEELFAAQNLETNFEQITELDKQLQIRHKKEIVVKAGQIMTEFAIKPGPEIGKLFHQIELEIVRGQLKNDVADILAYCKAHL
ncbi:CCA-adding enzyme [Lactococcus hodotermopsidis]|uniref:CCA-adding enzyme n=1 Tax=Pseudolactococcus hodotermopsidis TaxID=2709157 RepID=A0A6A0BFW2_9LACT|nr:CCA tRNA nucleotidyltransferase [Lactococcus hodotermopsidis]GFH43161.1 CCA-adding enzyme [Lactococcus hodotermopsidis]